MEANRTDVLTRVKTRYVDEIADTYASAYRHGARSAQEVIEVFARNNELDVNWLKRTLQLTRAMFTGKLIVSRVSTRSLGRAHWPGLRAAWTAGFDREVEVGIRDGLTFLKRDSETEA